MPTELEELVDFLHHGNTQVRQIAAEHVVPFTTAQPALFKRHQLLPVRDLKLLVRDYMPIACNALLSLVNLSADDEVLRLLAEDDAFVETLLAKVMNPKEPNAGEVSMLLANLAKSDHTQRLISLRRSVPAGARSARALDQLMDRFVSQDAATGAASSRYDYLAYLFADLSKHEAGRRYFVTAQAYDGVVPLSKLAVFTEHPSAIRRRGVAATLKNAAFEIDAHPSMLAPEDEDPSAPGANLLPYLLLPLAGPEELDPEESADMLPDLQLLPPDKKRDPEPDILTIHLDTLLLLGTTRPGRERMRAVRVYPLIREAHAHVEDDGVREACERLVQILMRDEEGDGGEKQVELQRKTKEIEEAEGGDKTDIANPDEDKMVDVF